MKKQTCILFFTFTSILAGCGGGNSKVPTTFSSDALMSEARNLTTDETNIAARICYAYQSKSINFRSNNFLGKTFNFSMQKTDCQNSQANYTLGAVLRYDDTNNLIYEPAVQPNPGFKFYKKVQTDTSGYLSQLCTKIKSGQTGSISNTTTVNGVKAQISFSHTDLDGFMLMYFMPQPDGTYKADSAETFKIRTQINFTTGQILGMDEFYSTQKVCSSLDKVKNSDFQQRFTSP